MPQEPSPQIDKYMRDASKKYGVEYELIKAIAKRESDFRPDAVREEPSINDASIGVMQVLVRTAQWQMNDNSITRERLMDPRFNIDVGAKYIRYNLDRFGGDFDKAIAAYNAGTPRYKSDGKTFTNQAYVDFVKKWYEIYKSEKIGLYIGIPIIVGILIGLFFVRGQL